MKNSIKNEVTPSYGLNRDLFELSKKLNDEVKKAKEDELIEEAMQIVRSRLKRPTETFINVESSKKFLNLKIGNLEHEVFVVMFLNNQHGLIEERIMFTGTIDCSSVYPREVVKAVLQANAAAVIFGHNHPSGRVETSTSDISITRKLKDALELIDVRVLDHIIVAGGESISLAETGQM